MPAAELASIMSEYLALERARVMRRLLVFRCGSIAGTIAVLGLALHWLPATMSWFSAGLFLIPPAWAWIAERRRNHSLGRRLGRTRKS